MKYEIAILSINDFIENVLKIKLGNITLEVLTLNLPTVIDKDARYLVDLEPKVFDEYEVFETDDDVGLKKIGKSMSYDVVGTLIDGAIHIGEISIFDEFLLSDYGYLENKKVKWKVDRFDIDFE